MTMPRKATQDALQGTQIEKAGVGTTPAAKPPKSPRLRLSACEPTEQDLLEQIVSYLRYEQARRRIAWFARVNGGGMMDRTQRWLAFYRLYLPDARPMSKGMADLHGMLADGRYFALEVKRPDKTPTETQLQFLVVVRDNGGIAAVVYSYADVKSLLFDERIPDSTQS